MLLTSPAPRRGALGSMGCFWPIRWCWRGDGQPARRCCRCPWPMLRLQMPASVPGCKGPRSGWRGTARPGGAERWAQTPAGRWSSPPQCDLDPHLGPRPPESSDWYLSETEGCDPAGQLQTDGEQIRCTHWKPATAVQRASLSQWMTCCVYTV